MNAFEEGDEEATNDMAPAASIAINVLIPPLTIGAWLMILCGRGDQEHLAASGRESLKYFTVLSNLLSAFASAVYLVACLRGFEAMPRWLIVLKLAATAAVMLTFLTVVVLLGPELGWEHMYEGGNLWLHLILPLLAALDCCLFVPVGQAPIWTTACAMVPTALYGAGYLRAILVHGAKADGKVYDFYHFLRWGWGRVPVLLAGMLLASWLLGLGIWALGAVVGLS